MTVVLGVAGGYVLGRLVAHVLDLAVKVAIRMTLERSERYRALVRRDLANEARLKDSLRPGVFD